MQFGYRAFWIYCRCLIPYKILAFDNTQKPSSSSLKRTEAQQKANDNNKIQQEPKDAPKETKPST